jgi:glycosyltransferase involved in cell wall biosynthesis
MTKLLWHSNGPWVATGYGQQTALFAPILADRYELAISAFYGLEGSPIQWNGVTVLPGLGTDFGNDTLPLHVERYFGDRKGGLVVTLCDVWPLNAEMARTLNMICWCPVDHAPAPPNVLEFLRASEAVPVAMSRFGERMLGPFDPLYCPHGVDTETLRPHDKAKARRGQFPEGAFVVGMVGANKGHPSRKAFPQALLAFSRFAQRHNDAYIYLQTTLDSSEGGPHLGQMIQMLGIPLDRIKMTDQYGQHYRPYYTNDMAELYSGLDVLLNPSLGEGFGIPIVEAQSCGVPVIVNDFSAMSELCGAGWKVGHTPYWSGLGSWMANPNVDEIEQALEECYALSAPARARLSERARTFALQYDIRRVAEEFMLPALRAAEQRFTHRELVRVPPRLREAA